MNSKVFKHNDASKDSYYGAMQASSQNWHEDGNDYLPFLKYMLGKDRKRQGHSLCKEIIRL